MNFTVKRTGKGGFVLIFQPLPPKAAEIILFPNVSQGI